MWVTWAETVFGATTSRSAICRLVRPAATSWATSNSRALSGYHGSAARPRSDEAVSRSAASARAAAPAAAARARTSLVSSAAPPRRRAWAAAGAGARRAQAAAPDRVPGPPGAARRLQRPVGRGYVAPGEQDEPPGVPDRGQGAGDGPGGQHRGYPVGPGLGRVSLVMRQMCPHPGEQVREQIGGVGDLGRALEASLPP